MEGDAGLVEERAGHMHLPSTILSRDSQSPSESIRLAFKNCGIWPRDLPY
jgi:hypothetical protein